MFMIIISGTASGQNTEDSGFIGGNVVNTSQMFFITEEACNKGRELMVASADSITKGLQNAEMEISHCEATEFERVEK